VKDAITDPAKVAPEMGTKAWAENLRTSAKTLVRDLDQGYMKLGELLYLAQTTRAKGDGEEALTGAVYTAFWGYADYEKWVTEELGLHERKARALKRIHERLAVELKDMPPELHARIVALGWTKVREVVRVLTLANAAGWADRGEVLNYHDFRTAVGKHVDALQQAMIDRGLQDSQRTAEVQGAKDAAQLPKAKAPAAAPPAQDDNDATGLPAPFEGASFDGSGDDAAEVDRAETAAILDKVPLPPPEKTIPFNFALYPEQADILKQALQRAEQLDPGKPKSYYLYVIAMEAASGYFGTGTPLEKRAGYLQRMADVCGLRIVAQDKESGALVLGGDNTLAKALRAGEV
jgi:hypothetical protein